MPIGPGVALEGASALQPPPCLRLELSSSGSLQKPSPVTAVPQRLALFKGPVAPSLSRQGLWLAGTSVPRPAQSWVDKDSKCFMTGNSVLLCLKAQDSTGHRYLPVLPTPPHPQPQKVAKNPSLGLGFQPSDLEGAFSGKGILAAGSG